MKIDLKQKNEHLKWLALNLYKRSVDARINPLDQPPSLSITLEPKQIGKRKPASSICKLVYKDKDKINEPVFWQFRESWQLLQGSQKSTSHYDFCGLQIKLLDESNSELMSVHWMCLGSKDHPYQPHWHLKFGERRFYVKKIHFPLNQGWNKYYPKDIDTYHAWLKGFLDFIYSEFPRCLQK